jgi:SPW repeat
MDGRLFHRLSDNMEEAISMRPWTRLQDWVTLLAGVYTVTSPVALSTIGMTGEGKTVVAMITLGALIALSSIVSLARPSVMVTEWATILFGVLLFIAPWVVGYTGDTGPAWTSWIVGVIVAAVGLTVVRSNHRRARQAMQH